MVLFEIWPKVNSSTCRGIFTNFWSFCDCDLVSDKVFVSNFKVLDRFTFFFDMFGRVVSEVILEVLFDPRRSDFFGIFSRVFSSVWRIFSSVWILFSSVFDEESFKFDRFSENNEKISFPNFFAVFAELLSCSKFRVCSESFDSYFNIFLSFIRNFSGNGLFFPKFGFSGWRFIVFISLTRSFWGFIGSSKLLSK